MAAAAERLLIYIAMNMHQQQRRCSIISAVPHEYAASAFLKPPANGKNILILYERVEERARDSMHIYTRKSMRE